MSLDLEPEQHGAPPGPEPARPLADASPGRLPADEDLVWSGPLGLRAPEPEALRTATWSDLEAIELHLELEEAMAFGPLDQLLAPDLPLAEPDATAVQLVQHAFGRLEGRGIVVEPSGPGGPWVTSLAIAELAARGLGDHVLVAGAPGTAERTAADVQARSGVHLDVALAAGSAALSSSRLVLDHDLVEAEVDTLVARPWDLVVVEAAHHVAGDDAAHVRQALSRLLRTSRWALLVTPAPARDDLVELRRLAELVRPGTFRPEPEFRARLVDPDVRHSPSRPDELRRLLSPVLAWPQVASSPPGRGRELEHHEVESSPEEAAVADAGIAVVADSLSGADGWAARRTLVPHLALPGPGLAAAARRAAELAPDDARPELLALAESAGALEPGPRHRLLATLVRLWAAAHGRVLVVADHAGAAQQVAEVLAADGSDPLLVSRADEQPPGRAARDVDVVVATDVALLDADLGGFGAVVCVDLPWDPVVLEDRLSAAGDEGDPLAVATFATADSVDATVAEVLTDQLQLFQRASGWARAVLAELDPATSPTGEGDAPLAFSDRLVVALTEDPEDVADALEDLADDLEAASRRTRNLQDAAARLAGWMVDEEDEHADPRASHPRAGRLRDLIARWATDGGGHVVRHEPSLLVTTGLLGEGERRWTFDRAGRRTHPTAALVAPGSPAFAELAAAVRGQVPVAVEVAEPVDLPTVSEDDHVAAVALVDRLVEPPSSWSAAATWRLRRGTTDEAFTEVGTGTPPTGRASRRPLDPGEPLPSTLPTPDGLVAQLVGDAAEALASEADALETSARSAAEAVRARLLVHHHAAVDVARAEIEESVVGTPEHDRATEHLRALHVDHPSEQPVGPDSLGGRVRAELVAVCVAGGDDFEVVERWRHDGGAEAEVRYPWDPEGVALRRSEVSGEPVAVLALCVDGHAVDEGELVVCPSCEHAGCDACGVVRALGACPTCGQQVCGTCRLHEDRFGACRGCRTPARDEQADTEHARAWRLGGGATLLVGERWAELRRPGDDEPLVVVPDVDVDDPDRCRLRRAADALGLPLDVGAAARPPGPRPLPGPDDLWMEVLRGEHWKVEEDRGSERSVSLDGFDGPDGPDPLVEGESGVELADLLERLRDEVPPPPPPAFVRTPHVDVSCTTLRPDGLVRTVDRVGADRTVERLEEERAPLVAAESSDDRLFRPVAEAHLEPVQLVLTRLHRSSVLRVTTPTGTFEWHLAAEPGVTFGAELAWASWAEEEGLGVGAVLQVDPERPVLAPEDLAAPQGATLQRRTIVDVWGAAPSSDEHPDAAAATDDDLVLVGYDEVPDLAMRHPAERHVELGAALHQAGQDLDPAPVVPHLLGHRYFEMEEAWEGRAPVRLAYKVSPGEPAWPRLDDTHQRACDFEVDDHGHLHEPGTGWQCHACGEHHCRACGPVGAMDPCPTCAQPACGLCRARTPRPVADECCDVCGDRSCGDCGRLPLTATCGVCRRSVCQRCQVAVADEPARCAACAALRPATEEEVDGLPPVLAAHGLQVQLGSRAGEVSVVLLGAWRTEVVVLRGGTVVWWVHHDDEDPLVRSLLLAAARRWSPLGDVLPVGTGWSTRPEVDGPGLLLVAEEVPEVRWTLEVEDRPVAGSDTPPRPAGAVAPDRLGALDRLEPGVVDVLRREVEAGDPAGRTAATSRAATLLDAAPPPEQADAHDPVAALRQRLDLPPGARLLVEDRQRATATWLTPDGLQRLISEGDDDRRTQAPWQVGVRFSWMTEGWAPTPEVVAYALLGDLEAALVRVGRHVALGVRGDGRVVWWTLRDEPGDLQRTLLGEHLTGEERLLDLRVVTDPGKVEGPTVLDATFVDRRIEPVLQEVGTQDGDPDEALRAAAAWVRREAAAPVPTGPPLDEDLRVALVERADELSPPVLETVGIALQVVETWRQGIEDFLVPYRLAPGTTQGLLTCVDGGAGTRVAHRDRSGHLVREVERCPWCEAIGCEACHERVRACPVCSVGVCDRCALEDGRCPTCATLGALDRKDTKRLGLKVGRKAVVLRAASEVRTVLAVHDGGWTVQVEALGTPVDVLPDDRRVVVLDQVAAAPPPPPPPTPPPTPPPPPASPEPVVSASEALPEVEEAAPPT